MKLGHRKPRVNGRREDRVQGAAERALADIVRAAGSLRSPWALIGGQALQAHGVPRDTLDADALVPSKALELLASELVHSFGWTPLRFDADTGDFADADEVGVHFMQDPVLFDVGEERRMIPLRTADGFPVDLLAAQHPVERAMIAGATVRPFLGLNVPVAPLGGVLLVKAKADRLKDSAAIEQSAEHLKAPVVKEAVEWARRRDPATAEDLLSIMTAARMRRNPSRIKVVRRR